MRVRYGEGPTEYGPGVSVELTGDEVATAIDAHLVAHGIHVRGPRTVSVNGSLCEKGEVYVDPSGFLIRNGSKWSGKGPEEDGRPVWYARTFYASVYYRGELLGERRHNLIRVRKDRITDETLTLSHSTITYLSIKLSTRFDIRDRDTLDVFRDTVILADDKTYAFDIGPKCTKWPRKTLLRREDLRCLIP